MNYKGKTVCVIDQGLFAELAVTLSKSFGKTLYYSPWESAFPNSNQLYVGNGLKGVERVTSPWPFIDEIDLFVFPDVHMGAMQVYLEKQGKRVWGSRHGEQIEMDRVGAKKLMKQLGVPIGKWTTAKGTDALRDHLKTHDNQWVKVSTMRGDCTTFCAENYNLSDSLIDDLEHKLGAKKYLTEFIVEDAITPAVEIGYDGFCIDGKFPKTTLVGIEVKDAGYVGFSGPYSEIPDPVRMVNDRLAPYFEEVNYRGFFSSELRVTEDNTPYMIDPCARMGAPPGYLQMLMIKNLPDVLWYGAEGEVVDPEFTAPWGAEIIINSKWAEHNWQPVEFPSELRDNVKLRYLSFIKNRYYVLPQLGTGQDIAADAVAIGDTMHEAIESCKKIAKKIKGPYLEIVADALDEAEEQYEKLGKWLNLPASEKARKPPVGSLAETLQNTLKNDKSLSDTLLEALER